MKAPPRPSMSKTRRARIFAAHKGVCELCGTKIMESDYDIEHRIPWSIAHDDTDPNLYPAHKACHAQKTALKDAPTIAHVKRMAGETGQYARRQKNGPQIKSRGFDKTQTKGFDGKVRLRPTPKGADRG